MTRTLPWRALRQARPTAHLRVVPDAVAPADAPDAGTVRLRTEERHLRAAATAATEASARAEECWRRLLTAVESNHGADRARAELQAVMAEQRYAWAVYHCAAADARAQEHPPTDG